MTTFDLPVVMVLAVADNGVIGRNNGLPWDLPDDLRHFKRTTLGCPVLMGRKTFESVGRPLPGRTNIVLTRDTHWCAPGVEPVQNLDEALSRAQQQAVIDGARALYVIGGAEIYRQALGLADEVIMTRVHGVVSGDATFDLALLEGWREIDRQDCDAGDRNSHDFSIVHLKR